MEIVEWADRRMAELEPEIRKVAQRLAWEKYPGLISTAREERIALQNYCDLLVASRIMPSETFIRVYGDDAYCSFRWSEFEARWVDIEEGGT